MSKVVADLKYTRSHEWLRQLPGGDVEIGISDHAQESLGDLVFVELPEVGRHLTEGEACAVVESVKAASDIYAPLEGTVTAVNEQLSTRPELINQDPYAAGWIMRITPVLPTLPSGLLPAQEYTALADKG